MAHEVINEWHLARIDPQPEPTMGQMYFAAAPMTILYALGPYAAMLYARIKSLARNGDGVCYSSYSHIARTSGFSANTVKKHKKRLEEMGYIVDLTPDRRNRPHRLKPTGAAEYEGAAFRSFVEAIGECEGDPDKYMHDHSDDIQILPATV